MWGVSSEIQAHVCFYFPMEAKPQLLVSFLEERNPQHICRLGHRIGSKKIWCWGVSVYREGKIFCVTINFIFLASSQSVHWKNLYLKIMYFFQQNIISSCLGEESFPWGKAYYLFCRIQMERRKPIFVPLSDYFMCLFWSLWDLEFL